MGDDLDGELLAVAVSAAHAAGRLLLDSRSRTRLDVDTKSSATDMVTEVDRASEALVLATIRSARPDDAVLGEEGGHATGTSSVRWVVDPLDGTTNFLYGLPIYGVSIAAEVDGEPAVGVVHDPNRNETFSAIRGRGAFLNGAPIVVNGAPALRLATALVGTGFGYVAERRAWQAAVMTRVLPAVRDIRRAGAAAVDLCWVACGRLDAFYEFGLQLWDAAAGGLIASEAGAFVGTLAGDTPMTDTLVAAAPQLAGDFQQLLRDAENAITSRV